jgi:hypothetical protein
MTQDEYNNLPPGWSSWPAIHALEFLIQKVNPANVLEIGSFLGRGTVIMCNTSPSIDIVCIDTWNNQFIQSSTFNNFDITPTTIQTEFINNVKEFNVTPIRGDFRNPQIYNSVGNFDLIVIDVHRDLVLMNSVLNIAWRKTIKCMAGAHYSDEFPIVKSVVDKFAELHNATVTTQYGYWWMDKDIK